MQNMQNDNDTVCIEAACQDLCITINRINGVNGMVGSSF